MSAEDGEPPGATPRPSIGRARDLSRTRTTKPQLRNTGRRHHIGEVPAVITVIKPDGTVATTRTSALQLKDQTVGALTRLADVIEAEMRQSAASLQFELAAHLRDELDAVRRELASR